MMLVKTYKKFNVWVYVFAGIVMLCAFGVFFVIKSNFANAGQDVRRADTAVLGSKPSQGLSLGPREMARTFTSQVYKTDFTFNAIAPHWQEDDASDTNRKMEMRTSLNGRDWTGWLEIEASGPLRDDDPYPERTFSEVPLPLDGNYFQYRLELKRASMADPSPQVYDMKVNQINSRTSRLSGFISKLASLGSNKVSAANQDFNVVSRAEWGSPDPYGEKFRGTDKYWPPAQSPVKQVVIHHTVTPSYQSDPAAYVRAIWDYHANTRGWGDIGYNYLIDSTGKVYQGRYGGDNVIAGHVSGYNKGSLGVAILGCFESTSAVCNELNGGNTTDPSATVIDSLTTLLSRKTTSFEIDPKVFQTFCDSNGANCLNIPTVVGHRDITNTSCPGDLTHQRLGEIRDAIATKNSNTWSYSAKQLTYGGIDMSVTSPQQITLQFKNTGSATWSNSSNKVMLQTAEPVGRLSAFEGSGWLNGATPAVLNEASVAPGQTGSFTFNINRPDRATDFYYEGLRLITDGGATFGGAHILPVRFFCTIGSSVNPRPNGTLIHNPADGKVYLIEGGKKRHIGSPLGAFTNGYDLRRIYNVSQDEVNSLVDGSGISLREGTLLKSQDDPRVYILDDTLGGTVRRWVTSPETMSAFGMKFEQVQIVSQEVVNTYSEGPSLSPSSAAPDGLLLRSDNDVKVYLIEAGKKRWITTPSVFLSHGYQSGNINVVDPQRLSPVEAGSSIEVLRTGSLVRASGDTKIYTIEVVNGVGYKKWITSPNAFLSSGLHGSTIFELSASTIDTYANATELLCHK